MKKKERALLIHQILDHHFPNPEIPLVHESAFTLLIAVLLSAQCTDDRVNLVTSTLFKKAKTPFEMVQLEVQEIEKMISSLGLAPKKSRAIHELSKILIDKHQGEVPCHFEDLEELPGVGHKTASVVMAQWFHIPAFPIDTHIFRCAKRWKLSSGKNVLQTEKDLKKIFPKDSWNRLHLQIIYFARKYCKAKSHDKESCPICSLI